MRHMALDEMTRRKRGAEGQFTSQDTSSDDARELARVVAGVGGVGAADAEEVEHCGLGLEDGAAAEGADFDGGHGDGDLEVAAEAVGFVS